MTGFLEPDVLLLARRQRRANDAFWKPESLFHVVVKDHGLAVASGSVGPRRAARARKDRLPTVLGVLALASAAPIRAALVMTSQRGPVTGRAGVIAGLLDEGAAHDGGVAPVGKAAS